MKLHPVTLNTPFVVVREGFEGAVHPDNWLSDGVEPDVVSDSVPDQVVCTTPPSSTLIWNCDDPWVANVAPDAWGLGVLMKTSVGVGPTTVKVDVVVAEVSPASVAVRVKAAELTPVLSRTSQPLKVT